MIEVKKKTYVFIAIFFSALILVPVFSALAITPKPKIVVRMELPIIAADPQPGTNEQKGDKIIMKDLVFVTNDAVEEGATLAILQFLPNTEPGPSHVPAPSVLPFPVTHMYSGGEIYAVSDGIRDQYTIAGKWHMDWIVTWEIDGVDSGFTFRHDCTGIGSVHAATWGGEGFGLFKGVKVSGISIADLMQQPLKKILSGEVSSGFDNLPPRNIPPFT